MCLTRSLHPVLSLGLMGLFSCANPQATPAPEATPREPSGPEVAAPDAAPGGPEGRDTTTPGEPTPGPTAEAVTPLDLREPGVHVAGRWEYRFTFVARGSKSEGTRGVLLYDGKAVEEPMPGDYYETPWGDLVWLGHRDVMWGAQGWMPREPGAGGGHALVAPWRAAGAPVVMAMVLSEAKGQGADLEAWVRDALAQLGVRAAKIERAWAPLTDQALTIEDTKLYGALTLRQAQPRAAETLAVLIDGTSAQRVTVARRDGATTLARVVLDAGMEPRTLFVALRVERASLGWPAPLDLGPESDGKVVTVSDVSEVVVALPGDRTTGLVWSVTSVVGDSPRGAAVKVLGTPQFVAEGERVGVSRPGRFENLLRVVDTGRVEVVLAYQRPWQPEVPPERTYRVTLDVVSLPTRAGRAPGGGK